MLTVIGLGALGLTFIGIASDLLLGPEPTPPVVGSEDPPCPSCGWPPWSVMPCLCPEEERGPAYRGTPRS